MSPQFASGPTSSSLFDYVFAFASLGAVVSLLVCGLCSPAGGLGRMVATGYCALWAFLVLRVHAEVAWLGGLRGFIYLSSRFPATWLNTMTYFPLFFASKLVLLVLCEAFVISSVGQVYECSGGNLSLERYARMAFDMDKPLTFRKAGSWWKFCIYPHLVSTTCAVNIYCLGPFMGFGILNVLVSNNHVIFRNGLFSTHPAYNYHVTIFFDSERGKAWFHTAHALVPYIGVEEFVYKRLWNFYTDKMIEIIEESETRDVPAQPLELGFDTAWKPVEGWLAWEGRERKHAAKATPIPGATRGNRQLKICREVL